MCKVKKVMKSFSIEDEKWKLFLSLCRENDFTASNRLNAYIEKFIERYEKSSKKGQS